MKYTIKKGEHTSNPWVPKPWVRKVEGWFQFLPESTYHFSEGDTDQYDWNKMVGISFNPLYPNENAILIGWRYNTNLKLFQIAPYYNVKGSIINPDSQYPNLIIDILIGEWVAFKIDYWGINYRRYDESYWYRCIVPLSLRTSYFTSFRVQPWFGGNRTAPNDIQLNLNL